MEITKISPGGFSIQEIDKSFDGVDGLDSMMIEAMADRISVMQQAKVEINKALLDPNISSDPGLLAGVQAMIADYSLNIEFTSKFASTILKNVDTLVKS